jgi:hypothetical protein
MEPTEGGRNFSGNILSPTTSVALQAALGGDFFWAREPSRIMAAMELNEVCRRRRFLHSVEGRLWPSFFRQIGSRMSNHCINELSWGDLNDDVS